MSLSFVLLVDDELVHAWQAEALRQMLDAGLATPALVVRRPAPAKAAPRPRNRWRQLMPGGTGLWQMFERWIAPRSLAIRPTPLPAAMAGVACLTATALPPGTRGRTFTAEDLAAIAAARPDFIVRFGFGILRGEILNIAPHGVWSFHHGDPAAVRGQPPGFWEIALGHPRTGVILQQLSAELDGGRILHAGHFATIAHSYARQRDQLYFGAAGWLRRACAALDAGELDSVPQTALGPVLRKPTNRAFLRFAWRTATAKLAVNWRSLFVHQHWTIGVIDRPVAEAAALLAEPAGPARDALIRWLPDRRDTFYADPFPLPAPAGAAGLTIMAEAYPWQTGRGQIVAIGFDGDRGFAEPVAAWPTPFHCSYPYVLAAADAGWCLPETAASGVTRRYPIRPGGVDFAAGAPLFPAGLIDPTVVIHDGRHWLFGGDPRDPNTLLNLYHADRLDGPWQPHPLNPVKTDIGSARPAGQPFVADGALIRPGQDCAGRYGARIVLNRITALTPTAYREEPWRVLDPVGGRHAYGLHTISHTMGRTVIDGARRRFVPAEFRRALAGKLRRGQR